VDELPVRLEAIGVELATVKLVVAAAAVKFPFAAWLACSTTVPVPVNVTVLPEIVAGPLTTVYVIAPLEAEVALTVKGAVSSFCGAIAAKLSVGTSAATVKLVVAVAAAKFPLAAWLALSTTVPAPVSVTVLPTIVAGPLTTVYVTAPLEAEVALTMKGTLPKVCDAIAAKLSVGTSAATVKLVVVVAAAKFPLAAWLALSTTVPAPVSVTVLPMIVAGPLTTEYVTAPLEAEVALTAKGTAPNVCDPTGAKLSVGTSVATVKLVVAVAAAKFPFAAWLAFSTTVPMPVRVTMLPTIVAGPLTTEYVTAPLEAEVALTAKGAAPNVCDPTGAKLSVGTSVATVKLVVAVAAAKFPLAAWLAFSTTVPMPVRVTMLPTIVAGPLTTEYVTAPVEAEVALTAKGTAPNVCDPTAKLSVGTSAPTVKLAEAVAATKFPLATWLAFSTTVPMPVRVTILPTIVAGPLTTEYVTAPLEAEVALTAKGALPNVCDTIGAKFNGDVPALTVKLAVAVAAAKFPLAAWLAFNTTVPVPVRVTMLPAIVAGPLTTEYVTAPLEAEVALTAKGAVPNVCDTTGMKLSVGASVPTVKLVVAVAAAKFPFAA